MNNMIKMSVAAAVMMSVTTISAQADGVSLLDNVKVKGELRPRYEMVDTNNDTGNANAITNRLVLGARADVSAVDGMSVFAEMTDVHALNNDSYKSTNNSVTDKNVVADPEQTRLTQAYVDVKYADTLVRVGRQMVNLDNQRFIGAVGWRQMPQTYDAILVANSSVKNLNLAAAYVTQVNTIKAENSSYLDTRSLILHAVYKVSDALTITAYDYMYGAGTGDNTGATNGVGSDTLGIALTGKPKIGGMNLNYRAEYAVMKDPTMENANYTGINDNYNASYMNLELGVNVSGILASVGYEIQSGKSDNDSSSETKTFSTPLGTNHKFNGWADQFLATPDQGLKDLNIMLGYKNKQVGLLKAIYHDFSSDEDSISYGTEIDLLYKRAIPNVKGLTGMLKYADYSADDSAVSGNPKATDTQKFWVMLDYKFSN